MNKPAHANFVLISLLSGEVSSESAHARDIAVCIHISKRTPTISYTLSISGYDSMASAHMR